MPYPSAPNVLRRLDHLICEVRDIHEAHALFTERLGFPEAWPIGPFWPQALTSGVALGGINLEFLQRDSGGPEEAQIRTLVFEPTDLQAAVRYYEANGPRMEIRDKWEPDPALLQMRGFSELESQTPQRICTNLVPLDSPPVDFFLCEYVPMLRQRLGPDAFAGLPEVLEVVVAAPDAAQVPALPLVEDARPRITLIEAKDGTAEVAEIRTQKGALDLGAWPARFRFA